MSDKTSKKMGKLAAKTLKDKDSTPKEKSLAGSVLSQVEPDKKEKEKK